MKLFLQIVLRTLAFTACQKPPAATDNQPMQMAEKPTTIENKPSADKSVCSTPGMEGRTVNKSTTIAFDYEPFKGSCFVTFESEDIPRDPTFHIYKDGKSVYDFEDAFDGMKDCLAENVSFEDLNADGDVDIIIAGKCDADPNGVIANAVYENNQKDFHTYASQNAKLGALTNIKQISDFVKKNPKKFFDHK